MKHSQALQVWQVIDSTQSGDIAALMVDGKVTRRKAYFPYVCMTTGAANQRVLNDETAESLPF